jgi:hypothetical protein
MLLGVAPEEGLTEIQLSLTAPTANARLPAAGFVIEIDCAAGGVEPAWKLKDRADGVATKAGDGGCTVRLTKSTTDGIVEFWKEIVT